MLPSCTPFPASLSVSDPNPVLVKNLKSFNPYPKVYYDARRTFLCSVYFVIELSTDHNGVSLLYVCPTRHIWSASSPDEIEDKKQRLAYNQIAKSSALVKR